MTRKLTVVLGEREADALGDLLARHRLDASVVLRGAEGFGAHHGLHTDRLLTLSEDLPVVALAVGEPGPIAAAMAGVSGGLALVEDVVPPAEGDEARLTLYARRDDDHRAIVATLHRHGVAGATVLLGIDGTLGGVRHRARFFSRNDDVPLLIVAVGAPGPIEAALRELPRRPATLERIRVCKRDGVRLADPVAVPPGARQRLTVYSGEQSGVSGALVRALRRAGAAGATSVRGIWGYHGDHAPHGDTLWQLRRRVPVVTLCVDGADRFPLVDELTAETGLVTSEVVPG